MIFVSGFNHLGQRIATACEQREDLWTLHIFPPGQDQHESVWAVHDLAAALTKMHQHDAMLFCLAPVESAPEFMREVADAMASAAKLN